MMSSDSWLLSLLIVASIISFWIQALITSERFVPALNVICTHFRIPDDVAGATLMAAGASGPELVVVFISVFFTHSSLGIGTVIGSEIFNELIICAGSVLAAKNQQLNLDPPVIVRELMFYSLSLLILCAVVAFRMEEDHRSINITIIDGLSLLFTYVGYVVVCAKFDDILRVMNICRTDRLGITNQFSHCVKPYQTKVSQIAVPSDMPFIRSMSSTDTDIVKKTWRSNSGLYVIEKNDSPCFSMERLYCIHDEMNENNDNELDSYFKQIEDSSSLDNESTEYDAHCLDEFKFPRFVPKCDVSSPNVI